MITLVFDTETTGIPKHPTAQDKVQPRIIEFGGALVDSDGNILEELNLLINPGKDEHGKDIKLEEVITKITGLTDEDLKDAPSFAEVAPQIMAMFRKADADLAHNLPFDFTMMELDINRAEIPDWPWPSIRICTVQEHAEEWGRRPKLIELFEYYTGEKLEQKHRAIDDVKALAVVAKEAGVL